MNETMDPEQLVAQLAELRTQNQQLHQALQQMQHQQGSTASPRPSLDRFPTIPCADSGRGSGSRYESSTSQSNLGGHERPRFASATGKHAKVNSCLWHVVSVHRGARDVLTWAVERESATVTLDASGHSANAGRSAVHSADDPRGERVVRHPCGLWIGRRAGSLAASAQTMGPPDDGKSKRIAQRDPLSPCVFLITHHIFLM